MSDKENKKLSEIINDGVQKAVLKAVDRHRKLGQSIVISENGQIVILSPQEIEQRYGHLLVDLE